MAIIKFGVAVVGARGTAGGLTFSANKAGPYFKTWSKSSNPRAVLQTAHRNQLADFAANWRNLTQVQRDDWDDYADDPAQELTNSLGVDYFISGSNWYVRINLNLQAAGASPRVDAPTLTRPVAPIIQFLFMDDAPAPGRFRMGMNSSSPGLTENHVVFALLSYSQGRTPIPLKMPFITIAVPDVSDLLNLDTEFTDKFGAIQLGTRAFASVAVQDADGRRGPVDTVFTDAV